jgi:hypothetical protein
VKDAEELELEYDVEVDSQLNKKTAMMTIR